MAKNVSNRGRELPGILEDAENELTATARQPFSELYEDLGAREQRIARLEHSIRALGSQHDVVRRPQTERRHATDGKYSASVTQAR